MRVRFPFAKLVPASGGGPSYKYAEKSIRLVRYGCRNRPWYHIIVILKRRSQHDQPIEQLGTFDPMPNMYNEKLCSLNLERIQYWLGERTTVSQSVAHLLGLSGLLPIHPFTYMTAWQNRRKEKELAKNTEETAESEKNSTSV